MDSKSTQATVENLYQELDELKAKTGTIRTKINQIGAQMDETVKKRDALNAEVKRTSEEARVLRAKRDLLNLKVKELKESRDLLREKASQKREALSKLLEQVGQISKQLQGSVSELSRQIKGLDWFIQTNPLSMKTERSVVAKISALEVSLAKHKGLRNVKDKLFQLRIQVGALRLQAQAVHQELTKVAEESERAHEAMQDLLKKLGERKKEADARHSDYIEQNQVRRDLLAELREVYKRMDEVRAQIGEAKTLPALKAEKLKSKYKEAANEKLRTGGKLSFEEFQALMADSQSEEDDE